MKYIKKYVSLLLVIAFVLCICVTFAGAENEETESGMTWEEYTCALNNLIQEYETGTGDQSVAASSEDTIENTTNRLIVTTYSNDALADDCGAVEKIEGYNNWHILQYTNSEDLESAYDFYEVQEYVQYVERDFIAEVDDISEDETAKISGDVLAVAASNMIGSVNATNAIEVSNIQKEDVIVAIIDSGLNYEHKFLEENGCTDRIIDSEVNISSLSGDTITDTTDTNGHGTHLAGIILNNTPSNVKISPYKLFKTNDWDYANLLNILERIISDMGKHLIDIDIINMSFSTQTNPGNNYETLVGEFNALENLGVTIVVASGNKRTSEENVYPGCIQSAITVSNVNTNGEPLLLQGYGKDYIDIAAPGELINSTVLNDKYQELTGTSQAAAFVSAAAATLKTVHPEFTPDEILERLQSTAYIPNGWDDEYGVGIINYTRMLEADMLTKPIIGYDSVSDKMTITLPTDAPQGTEVYYTLDKSFPDPDTATLYTAPIDVSDPSIRTILAITNLDGTVVSLPAVYLLRWSSSTSIQYKGTGKLTVPNSITNLTWTSNNPSIVSVDSVGNATGLKRGTATVVGTNANHQTVTYEVTVDYVWWQWLIVIFLFGWAWY